MARLCKNRGFSLTEVLLSVGILAVGMIFIAGVFPAGIYFMTIATERSIAAVVADEAFAKIRLYDINLSKLSENKLENFNEVLPATIDIDPNEFAYPSASIDISRKQYFWSALCRLAEDSPNPPVQVTVFVCRKVSPNLRYFNHNFTDDVDWPVPVRIDVTNSGVEADELEIDKFDEKTFINDGYTIVDNETGRIYRVLERYRDNDKVILLDSYWQGSSSGSVWVVPPPLAPGTNVGDKQCSGRYPCIAVYQKGIRF